MIIKKQVYVDKDTACAVLISDYEEALLAARSANRASIAVIGKKGLDISLSRYAVFEYEDIDETLLLEVAKRHLNLPLIIAGNEKLIIREFVKEDFEELKKFEYDDFLGKDDKIFRDKKLFLAYIKNQYEFYSHGMYALIRREDKRLLGKVGFYPSKKDGEYFLSYHIKYEFRKKGYARLAMKELMNFAAKNLGVKKFLIEADEKNTASVSLAKSLEIEIEFC